MDKRQRILLFAFILSLLIHAGFLWLMDYEDWLIYDHKRPQKPPSGEVTIVFPENKPRPQKPREIIQNMNANEKTPSNASLLSEKNAQARNPIKAKKTGPTPFNRGNSPFNNLSASSSKKNNSFVRWIFTFFNYC